jgi:hypothetical protein
MGYEKTSCRIQDRAMRFWFQVYPPHWTRWITCSVEEMEKPIHDRAFTVFEDHCRRRYPQAANYWVK